MNYFSNVLTRSARMRQLAAMLLLALAMFMLAGCEEEKVVAGSTYWVPGLELPPNSEEVASPERHNQREMDRSPTKRSLQTVRFRNPDGWDKVAGQFYQKMWKLGYREFNGPGMTDEEMAEFKPLEFKAEKPRYDFARRNTEYTVTIQSDRGISKMASDDGLYTILITRVEDENDR